MISADEMLRLLLDQGKDHAIILLDPQGVVVGWLGGAETVFGFSAAEILGQPVSRLFTPEDLARGAHEHELAVARADGRAEDDRWHVRKDGTRIWASGVLIPLRGPAGEVVGFGKVLRDRTDVRAQIDALAAASRRKDVFLGTLAHELRAPLAVLTNATFVARQTAGPPPLDLFDRNIALIGRLVNDVMDVTGLAEGKIRLRTQVVKLEEVLTRAAEACRPQAEARRQNFQVLLLPTPTVVRADPYRLYQVVVNLLTNAVKYTPEGGGVWLKATVEGDEAVVRVEDTGAGVAPEMLPKIFDLFTQEEASRPEAQGGLGLGLPLVKELVTLHGGTVQVRSEGRGKGSEFSVRLPLPPCDGAGPEE